VLSALRVGFRAEPPMHFKISHRKLSLKTTIFCNHNARKVSKIKPHKHVLLGTATVSIGWTGCQCLNVLDANSGKISHSLSTEQIPVTDEEDHTVSWLQQFNDINACATVYQNNVLYLYRKKVGHDVTLYITNYTHH